MTPSAPPSRRAATAWVAVLVLALAAAVRGQEPPTTTPAPGEDARFSARWVMAELEEGRIQASGAVIVTWQGARLRCDSAVLWLDDGAAPGETDTSPDAFTAVRISELYAEGDVLLTLDDRVFQAHRVHLDLVQHRGLLIEARLRTDVEVASGRVPVVVRAAEVRQLAANRYEVLGASLTTSTGPRPGYRLETARMSLQIDPETMIRTREGERPVRNVRYELDPSVLYLENLPLVHAPGLTGDTGSQFGFGLIRGFSVGASRRFGPYTRLTLGREVSFDGEPWGTVEVPLQMLGDRGPGIGLDVDYARPDHEGRLQAFYQHDGGEDRHFGTPDDDDRGRVTWQHRHRLPEHVQLDLEFSRISDRGYLFEFEESEFKSEKEQETLLYAKRSVDNQAISFLAKARINDFQTQVEHLPRVAYDLVSEPLFEIGDTALYFDADYELSRVRLQFDEDLGLDDRKAFRVDLDNVLALPFFVGPVKIEPFGGLRFTHYDDGALTSRNIERVGLTWGARASMQLHRTYDARGGIFGLEGLRHVILPEIEYRNVAHVSHDVEDFIAFDRIDAFSEREHVRFGVRQRLQTLWEIDDELTVVDLVDLDVEWTWFPQPRRDHHGEGAGNLDVDLVLRPTPRLTFLTDLEYSFLLDTFEVANTTVAWSPDPALLLATGYRRYVEVNDTVFVTTQWRVDERLGLRLLAGYDFEDDHLQDVEFTIQRFGADWVFELEFSYEEGDGFGVAVAISPRALFDPRVRVRSIRDEPRFYGFDQPLLRR